MNALDTQLKPLLKFLDEYYAKIPALPKGATEFIVKVAPWLALIGAILSVLSVISLYGLMTYVGPFAAYAGVSGFSITIVLSMIVLLVWAVLYLLAFPSLKARKIKGWNLMLYGMLLYILSAIVRLNVMDIVSSLIGALIGYYFLYQVKSYYN